MRASTPLTWLLAATAMAAFVPGDAAVRAASPAPAGRLSSRDAEVDALLARMTLEEKIGQMTQAEQDKLADVKDIQTYFLGSLLSGGSSDPKTNSLQDW